MTFEPSIFENQIDTITIDISDSELFLILRLCTDEVSVIILIIQSIIDQKIMILQ